MSDGISAKSADNQPKQKRGRPRGIEAEWGAQSIAAMERLGLFAGAKSRRGRDTVLYRQRAVHFVVRAKDDRLKWLLDEDKIDKEEDGWKPSVLSELGRIDNPDEMLSVALAVCEARPSVGDAVRMVKRYRLGGAVKQGNSAELTDAIIGTVNRYLKEHDISWAEVNGALAVASFYVKVTSNENVNDT